MPSMLAGFALTLFARCASSAATSPSEDVSGTAATSFPARQWLLRWQAAKVGTRQYKPAAVNSSVLPTALIPRIILMTVASVDESLANYGHIMADWWMKNPEYTYMLLSDADCEDFLQAAAPPLERTAYSLIRTGASRADLFRAIWMRDVGGVYVDQDSVVKRPLRDVMPNWAPIVTLRSTINPKGVWTFNFLAFEPGCPLWRVHVRRVVERIIEQSEYACRQDIRGCRGFYACVQNVTGTRPFRVSVQEVTQRYGCHALHDCRDASDRQLRGLVVLNDNEMPMTHEACHARKGMRHPCKRPKEANAHYVSLPAADEKYFMTAEGRRDGSSAPAYFRPFGNGCAQKQAST